MAKYTHFFHFWNLQNKWLLKVIFCRKNTCTIKLLLKHTSGCWVFLLFFLFLLLLLLLLLVVVALLLLLFSFLPLCFSVELVFGFRLELLVCFKMELFLLLFLELFGATFVELTWSFVLELFLSFFPEFSWPTFLGLFWVFFEGSIRIVEVIFDGLVILVVSSCVVELFSLLSLCSSCRVSCRAASKHAELMRKSLAVLRFRQSEKSTYKRIK